MKTKRKHILFFRFPSFRGLGSFFLAFLLFLFPLQGVRGQSQEAVLVGQVFDKYTKNPLVSVDVYVKNSNTAVQTNDEGYFLIRYTGNENTLVFSLIGYQKEQIKFKPGESAGLQVELEEKENYLSEIFVLPGANPADDLMKKVRRKRDSNNFKLPLNSSEQSAVFLQKQNYGGLFKQFKNGNLSKNDSSLLIPLYIEQSEYKQAENKKEQLHKNTFNTSSSVSLAVAQLLNGMDERINFYENSIPILGKSIVSPLANIGGVYYNYYLKDSTLAPAGKQYEVQFWSKNQKNLAFNGTLFIDSTSLALTKINVELPRQANLNFIHNLTINQDFTDENGRWIPITEQTHWGLTYEAIADSVHRKPELLISRNSIFDTDKNIHFTDHSNFADTQHSEEVIAGNIEKLNETPLFKFVNYIAYGAMTGYLKVWKFDIGNMISVARITDQEGFRVGLPIRTNENMWKNFMLGGSLAYGFGDKKWKYSLDAQWKISAKKNIISGLNYQKDYHWITYDKNDFLWRESPLKTFDENISSTIFSFKSGKNNSQRENFSFFIQNDWSNDIESRYILGEENFFGNDKMPFHKGSVEFPQLKTQYFTFSTRFSFNERVINKHFQRIYLRNDKPVIYTAAEIGRFILGDDKGNYGHITAEISQRGRFVLGEWKYFGEIGKIWGNVPYPLLKSFNTKANGGYSMYQFSLMKIYEYPLSTYASFHSEIVTNGIIFNQIPLINRLNLREIASFKIGYGTASNAHSQWLDYPINSSEMKHPYSEISVGFTNFLKVISVQSVWRLTDTKKSLVRPWGLAFYINLGL